VADKFANVTQVGGVVYWLGMMRLDFLPPPFFLLRFKRDTDSLDSVTDSRLIYRAGVDRIQGLGMLGTVFINQ